MTRWQRAWRSGLVCMGWGVAISGMGALACSALTESVTPDQAATVMRLACEGVPDAQERTDCLRAVQLAAELCRGAE